MNEKIYASDEELIGILGQLLDEEEHMTMPEKVRNSIEEVYSSLCARVNNW